MRPAQTVQSCATRQIFGQVSKLWSRKIKIQGFPLFWLCNTGMGGSRVSSSSRFHVYFKTEVGREGQGNPFPLSQPPIAGAGTCFDQVVRGLDFGIYMTITLINSQ